MQLTEIIIKNFRGIEHLTIDLDELCVLIGENNAGKSTVLDAVKIALTRSLSRTGSAFSMYDYHLPNKDADPTDVDPLEVTLTFSERKEDEWPDEVSQLLDKAEQVGDGGLRSVTFRVKSHFDNDLGSFETTYDFLNLSGSVLTQAAGPRYVANLRRLVPTFYLSSLRDASNEFRQNSIFWGPFVKSISVTDDERKELEAALSAVNLEVLSKHEAFAAVIEKLKNTAQIMPLGTGDPVSIEAIPSRLVDILSKAQINLSSKSGAHIPIVNHGSGTQSLAVISLFEAFLETQLRNKYDTASEPILALEEPEAHLHPSAIMAVGKQLRNLSGQKIISTHSGDLLSSVSLSSIRRLRRTDNKVTVHKVEDGVLTPDETSKLDYQIRKTRGRLLFSRCWLLVEGETEAPFLNECAFIGGNDLFAEGVSCIEFAQIGVEKLIKLADQLGIEWFVLSDNDPEGIKYNATAKAMLSGRDEAKHIRLLDHGHMEVFLGMEGLGEPYKNSISPQKAENITAAEGTIEYWEQVCKAQASKTKIINSRKVLDLISVGGASAVPTLLRDVIQQSMNLAREAS